jgi:hypothetical protein
VSVVRFNPQALFATLNAERVRRGLSWITIEREIGVSSGTMKRLQTHDVFELDGILFLTQWVGREIEDFTGELAIEAGEGMSPHRRFDPPELFGAIDEAREQRGLTWGDVADDVAQLPSTLARLRIYKRFTVHEVLPITQWLGRRTLEFTRVGPPPEALRRAGPQAEVPG